MHQLDTDEIITAMDELADAMDAHAYKGKPAALEQVRAWSGRLARLARELEREWENGGADDDDEDDEDCAESTAGDQRESKTP